MQLPNNYSVQSGTGDFPQEKLRHQHKPIKSDPKTIPTSLNLRISATQLTDDDLTEDWIPNISSLNKDGTEPGEDIFEPNGDETGPGEEIFGRVKMR